MDEKHFTDLATHDVRDPNPWLALYLDNSIPMNKKTKLAMMKDNNSWSVRFLLPLLIVGSKLTMLFIHVWKYFFPKFPNSSRTLHWLLSWGLKNFVTPEANLLIFRHFHVGSEIMQFISRNIDGITVPTSPIKPRNFEDVKDDIFLKHDLNLYNFVINLNRELQEKNVQILAPAKLDLGMITEDQFDHEPFPNRWTNFLDLRSAIEVFTPVYQLFLTQNDFIRASNSLQLDETIAIYSSKILNGPAHLSLVNNRHPMVPVTTFTASYRLVLHGLAAETLHAILVSIKNGQKNDGIIITAEAGELVGEAVEAALI
jgi:hypothetical protein